MKDPVSFQILLRLGAGGMGEVHLALMQCAQGTEVVALKRLHRDMLSNPEVVGRFEREAKICSLLSHPLIVGLHRHGHDQTGPWLALEYVHGRSASQLIKEWKRLSGALPLPVALSICHDAALALSCAHALPVVHRDLSPDNVLVAYTGEAKLTDFGIAKMMDGAEALTRTGFVPGKAGFLSPEVLDGADGTAASDVFALGATFYRVLAGVRAFQGGSEVELLNAVLHSQPAKLATLRPEVPAPVAEWIDAALSKRPEDRPQLAGLAALITAALGGPIEQARAAVAQCMNTAFPAKSDAQRSELNAVLERTRSARPAPTTQEAVRAPKRAAGWWVAAGLVIASVAGLAFRPRPSPSPKVIVPQVVVPPVVAVIVDAGSVLIAPAPIPVPPSPRPPAPGAKKRKSGRLLVRSEPTVVIFVDGEFRGPAPIKLELPAGEHTVLFSHPVLGQTFTQRVEVRPGDTRLVTHRFASTDAGR